jgi:hypothetical protein
LQALIGCESIGQRHIGAHRQGQLQLSPFARPAPSAAVMVTAA